jgi:hypothetical protein
VRVGVYKRVDGGSQREGQNTDAVAEMPTIPKPKTIVERPSRRQIAIASANRSSPEDQADNAAQLRLLMAVTTSLLIIAVRKLGRLAACARSHTETRDSGSSVDWRRGLSHRQATADGEPGAGDPGRD